MTASVATISTTPEAEPTQTAPARSWSTAVMLDSGNASGLLPACGQASSTVPSACACTSPAVLAAHMPPPPSEARLTTVEPPKRVNQFSTGSKRARPPPSMPTQTRPTLSLAIVRT